MLSLPSRALTAFVTALALTPFFTAQDVDHVAVADEARAFAAHYIATLESRDEEALRALFVADDRFAWYTDGALSYASADDVLTGMGAYAGISFKTALADVTPVVLSAQHVSLRTRFETTLMIPNTDNFIYSGVITMLLEKRNEAWRVVLGHTSTPDGPPARK